jgi:hypothetical protein
MVQICPGHPAGLLLPSWPNKPPPAHRAMFFSQPKFQHHLSWPLFPLCESVNTETTFAFFLVEQNCRRRKEFWLRATDRSPPANSFARASVPLGLLSFSPSATGADPSPFAPLTRELKAATMASFIPPGSPPVTYLAPINCALSSTILPALIFSPKSSCPSPKLRLAARL